MKPFVARLAPEAAAAWVVRLRDNAGDTLNEADDEWQPLLTLVDSLQDRAHKVSCDYWLYRDLWNHHLYPSALSQPG